MVRRISYFVMAFALVACDTLDFSGFFISPGDNIDSRFSQSLDYTGDEPYAVVEADEDYTFYVCTDAHLDDTCNNLNTYLSDLRNDVNSSFGLFLGDAVDRKGKMSSFASALEWDSASQTCFKPVFVVPGNHDMFFSQWDDFKRFFGASVYYVKVSAGEAVDLFIALDSASGTLGESQMKWLRGFLEEFRSGYRHCVVFTHTNFFMTDNSQALSGNLAIEETLVLTELFDRHDVNLVLQGHDHYREDVVYRGTRYITVGAIEDDSESPEYLMVSVSSSGIADYKFTDVIIF